MHLLFLFSVSTSINITPNNKDRLKVKLECDAKCADEKSTPNLSEQKSKAPN